MERTLCRKNYTLHITEIQTSEEFDGLLKAYKHSNTPSLLGEPLEIKNDTWDVFYAIPGETDSISYSRNPDKMVDIFITSKDNIYRVVNELANSLGEYLIRAGFKYTHMSVYIDTKGVGTTNRCIFLLGFSNEVLSSWARDRISTMLQEYFETLNTNDPMFFFDPTTDAALQGLLLYEHSRLIDVSTGGINDKVQVKTCSNKYTVDINTGYLLEDKVKNFRVDPRLSLRRTLKP